MEPILEVENLRKNLGQFSIKDISFTLNRGYIMGFIGPNGAGKTTTIKLIMNLMKKDGGKIKVFGLDNIKYEQQIKNKIGFVSDESHFYEELTVLEMKRIIAHYYTDWDDKLFSSYLKNFDLPPRRKIKDLSKGMKMKFSLAIALSHHAELLLMDEPTSGLDPIVRSELLDILFEIIQDERKAVFFSTHITSDLDKVADYITLIDDGKIILSDVKDDIIEQHGLIKGSKETLTGNMENEFIGIRKHRFGFEALVNDKELAKKMFNNEVVIEKPTLEDLMLFYTRGKKNV